MDKTEMTALIVVGVMIAMDYFTGLLKALKNHDVSSVKMREGLYHKGAYVVVMALAEVIEHAKKVHDFLTVGAPAPLQEAACVGVRFPQSYYEELTALYTRKRDVFLAGLDRLGLKHNVPQGTYFVLLDISDFLALDRFRGWSDLEFCEWIIREIGVAAVPGSSFFREPVNHLIRLHFARSEETLEQALDRLAKLAALLH